jgi:nucleolar protein 12
MRSRRRIGGVAAGSDDEDNIVDDPQAVKQRDREKQKKAKRGTMDAAPRTLFVGNVDVRATVKDLRDLFRRHGRVESARLRSLPLARGKVPTKALVAKGKHVEDAMRPTCNAYIVFRDPAGVDASMAAFQSGEGVFAEPFHGHRLRADRVGGVVGSSLPAVTAIAGSRRDVARGDVDARGTPAGGDESGGADAAAAAANNIDTSGPPMLPSHTGKFDPARSVFAGNLPRTVTEDDLHTLFSSAGDVVAVRCVRDPNTSLGRGIAYILFKSAGDAENARLLTGTVVGGREMRVEEVKRTTAADEKRRVRVAAVQKSESGRNPAAAANGGGAAPGKRRAAALAAGAEIKPKKPRHSETDRKRKRRELALARERGEVPAGDGADGAGAVQAAPIAPAFGGEEAREGVVPNLKRNKGRNVSTINKGTKRKESGNILLKKRLRPTKPRN